MPNEFPFPLYETEGFASRPLGMVMCQNRLAVPIWSYTLETYPAARIIELGTYSGGLATALGVHAYMIGCKLVSYDRARIREGSKDEIERQDELARFLGIDFRIADMWAKEAEIAALIAKPGTTYILCDGGNKPRELEVFSQYMKRGDIIAAHDIGTAHWPWREFAPERDGDPVAAKRGLERWQKERFDLAGWAVYRRP